MEIWDFNLRHLLAIAKIAELGTMNAAAQAVNLTQPAITQALARTERLLGHPLFERQHDGMAQTAAAGMFVPRIRAALGHIASPNVTMARLRALLALADTGSYTAASHHTGLSAPSLHRAVSDLSLSMRRGLAARRGKTVTLTDAGSDMARRFRLARVEIEAGLAELSALKGIETRRIAIGAMPLARARVLPAAITRFLRSHPHVKLSIVEGSRSELVIPLRDGAIDLMIGALRDPLTEPDLVQIPLFRDRPVVVGRKGHPLSGASPGIAQLAAYPWIVAAPGVPLRDAWQRMFDMAGVPCPSVPVESGSVMTIRQLLMESDFLAMLSPDQVAVEFEAGWLEKIADTSAELDRSIGMTVRSSWLPTTVQADFVADLRAIAEID